MPTHFRHRFKCISFFAMLIVLVGCSLKKKSTHDNGLVKDVITFNDSTTIIEKLSAEEEKEKIIVEEGKNTVGTLPVGKQAPNFNLTSTEGQTISLSELKGNLVLIEFWFPGCKGCLLSIPMLNELQAKYSAKGLKVFGIEHRDVSETIVQNYMAQHNMQFPSFYNGKAVSKDYGVWLAPTFFLINKEGNIIFEHSYSDENKANLIKIIDQHLAVS